MVTEADSGDEDVLLLVHQLPLDMDGGDRARRLAHLLPPLLHTGEVPSQPPFRPPPPLQAAASAEHRLSFRGWLGAPRHWDLWVAKLRPIHADLWRRLGIYDAILSSTFRFRRDASALLGLASFWCPRTNTFAFPWGEATVTLHDVAVLAGFPAHGAPVAAPLPPEWRPDEAALNGVRLSFNRSACKKAHHSAWVKRFLTAGDDRHEHAAFLALWLTRFVLPGHPESTMRQSLFPIAVRLAHGERIALGPAVLASLYRDLRDIKAFLVSATTAAATTGNADMLSSLSLYAPLYILQLWLWERFPALRPGRENPLNDTDPLAARWHDLSRKINPTLIREALSSADTFIWQPYPCSMHATVYVRQSDLAGNDDLRMLAHCLHPCELVGMDCIEQYLPHRVARQFGLDQDVPGDVPRANQNWAVAWQTYELDDKNVAFFIPQTEPGVTARYTHWWRHQLPHCNLDDGGAPNTPAEWKTSKRKVKKTLVAMEAEEEKDRRLKKARISPSTSSDKKRKLEELYDSNLSNWLTSARNEIRASSLPKYDTALDDALLPNVGTTNDDVVLLVPRKQITSPAVMLLNDCSVNPAVRDRGTFVADSPSEFQGGFATAVLQEETNVIPAYVPSLDVIVSPEEGTTMVMESGKDASGASDAPEEVTTPATEDKGQNNAVEGNSCVAGMNRSVENISVRVEVDGGNSVSEEVGRAPEEANEVATQRHKKVDAGTTYHSHVAVAFPEEALPLQQTNNVAGCSKVSCIGLGTDAGERERGTACHDFVTEERREVPSVEVVGQVGDHQIVGKDNEEKTHEAPHIEITESAQDTALMGSRNEGESKIDPPTMEEVATSDIMNSSLPEAGNAEVMKDLTLETKHTEDMPMQVAEGEEVKLEQFNTSTKGTTEEEQKEFSDVDCAGMEVLKTQSFFDMDEPGEAVGVVHAEIEGGKGAESAEVKRDLSLAKRDTEGIPTEVAGGEVADTAKGGADAEHKELSEVDHIDVAGPAVHSHTDIEKPEEADVVECADIDGTMGLAGRGTVDEKHGIVPEAGNDEIEINRGLILGIKDLVKVEAVKKDVAVLEKAVSRETYGTKEEDTDGRLNEIHDVIPEVERSDWLDMDNCGLECVRQELQMRDETLRAVDSKEKVLADGNLRDEPLREEGTKEKPLSDDEYLPEKDIYVSKGEEVEIINDALEAEKAGGQDKVLPDKDIHDHIEEITLVVQVDGQNKSLVAGGTEELPVQTTQAHEKEFVDGSNNSADGEILCSSATVHLTGNKIEISNEDMVQEKHIQNFELIDQMEPSSDAAALMVEGKHGHRTLDRHEVAIVKHEQDHKIICDCREKVTLGGSQMIDTGLRPAADETHATVIMQEQDQKSSDMDKQLTMEERHVGIIVGNNKMDMSEGAYIMACDEHLIEVNETESTKGIRNQELLDNEEQLAIGGRQDQETVVQKNKMNALDAADILVSGENQTDPTDTEVNMVESSKGTQNKESFDDKEVLGERIELITDRNAISLEQAYTTCGDGGNKFAVSVDVCCSKQNMELLPMPDNHVHRIQNVNEKRILEDASKAGSGDLCSDADLLDVNMAESREGTLNKCALGEKEAVVPEKKDQGTADENTKSDLADIDAPECGGVKPVEAGKMVRETLIRAQDINIAWAKISSENRQEVLLGKLNITEVEGSESNQNVMKEPEEPLPSEPKNPLEVKEEDLENETEMSILGDNSEESEKDHTLAEVTITPNLVEQGENGNGLAEESTKSSEKLASNPKGATCILRLGKSSIEEVKRTYNTRSMYLKDINESLGRIRAEPLNRVQATGIGNYSRHAVQEPISVCKEIKVPLRDNARDFGRERAQELVFSSPPDETSRWRQEQYALQILEDVQNSRIAERTRMEMEIRVLRAQICSMERQVMNLDHFAEVKSRSKRH